MQICLNSLGGRFSNRIIVWKYIIWVTLYLASYNPLWVGNCLHGQVLPRIRDTLPYLFCSNSNVSKQQLMRIPETRGFHGRWTVPQYFWTKISNGEKAQWSLRLSTPPCKLTKYHFALVRGRNLYSARSGITFETSGIFISM